MSEMSRMMKDYIGKNVEVVVLCDERRKRYRGKLLGVFRSKHGGVGNVSIENENGTYLIRGEVVGIIILE